MNTRCIITLLTIAALLAGALSSAAETRPAPASADAVVASFQRDLDREPPPARPITRDDVAADVLYAYVNRPLQTPGPRHEKEDRQ